MTHRLDGEEPIDYALLIGEKARYDPNQPRRPDGKWGSGGISPVYSADYKPKRGELLTDDPTRGENLPPELVAEMKAKIDGFHPGGSANLEANIEAVLQRGLANPELAAAGRDWYGKQAHGAAQDIATRDWDGDIERATGGIAAMSPQQEWGSNLATADYVSRVVRENPVVRLDPETLAVVRTECMGERWAKNRSDPSADLLDGTKRLSEYTTRQQAQIIKAMGMRDGVSYTDDVTGTRSGARWTCGADGVEKAVRIFSGESPDAVLSGHKVRSFHNNILGGSDSGGSVTIDTHAVSLSLGTKYSAKVLGDSGILDAPSAIKYGVQGSYPVFADAYRTVAAKYDLSPEQVQAITWLQWRQENP